MTKHWKVEYGECAGCEYLLKHGLPLDFIRKDHEKELARQAEGKQPQEQVTVRCPKCGVVNSGPRWLVDQWNKRPPVFWHLAPSYAKVWCDGIFEIVKLVS